MRRIGNRLLEDAAVSATAQKLPTTDDLCEAGYVIPFGKCERCGATADDDCKLADELSPKEKRENVHASVRGLTPPH